MSTIDSRVVEMKFDNSQFQRGIQTSLSSLDSLKKGLNLNAAAKSLSDLDAAGKRFSLANMASSVEQISSKFSALGIAGVTAISNIANRAVNAGITIVKSLTIDPITAGLSEYETNLNAIQTILANTQASGATLSDVNATLAELNEYSDQTIYNFSEMAKNIGTFTAAGVDLDTSAASIKGIANLAALSGSNSQQASSAMYQLSQAIASGKVGLQDWTSVVTAGMGGTVFQRSLAETAVAMGKLDASAVALEGPMKNVKIAGESFRDSISAAGGGESWLSSEVLTTALATFTGDMTNAELAAVGFNEAQITAIQNTAAAAKAAATEVKTGTQLMDTLAETAGSGWSTTWQTIFGDFGEAKAMWTGAYVTLSGLIDAASNARNAMLGVWKNLGGRDAAIEAVKNAFKALMAVFTTVKSAFTEIFPPMTGQQLFDITAAIRDFTASLIPSEASLDALKRTFKGVFAVLDIGWLIIKNVVSLLFRLIGVVAGTGGGLLQVTGTIGDFLVKLRDIIKSGNAVNTFFKVLGDILVVPLGLLKLLADLIGSVFKKLSSLAMPKIDMPDVSGIAGKIEKGLTPLQAVGERIAEIWESIRSKIVGVASNLSPLAGLGEKISEIWGKLGEVFSKVWAIFEPVADKVAEAFRNLSKVVVEGMSNINYDQVLDTIQTGLFAGLILLIKKFIGGGKKELEDSGSILDGVKDILGGVTDTLGAMQQTLKANVILKIAIAIALLAVAVIGLASVDSARLETALIGLAGIFTQLMIALAVLGTMTKGAGFLKLPFIVASLILLAVAINLLVIAVKNMSTLSWDELLKGLAGVGGLLISLAIASRLMSKERGALLRTAATMILIATAVRILVTAVRELGEIDKVNLTKGLIAVAGLLVALALFSKIQSGGKSAIVASVGFIILAEALKRISDVVKTLGEIDKVNLIKGVGAVTVILGALAAFSRTVGNPVQLIIAGAAMIVIGEAMKSISESVNTMGSIDKVNLIKGLGAITVILGAIMAFSRTVGNPVQLVIAGAAMIIIGEALRKIALAVYVMGSIDKVNLIKGLGAITVILGAIMAFSKTVGNPIQLVIAGAAMLIIGNALQEIARAVLVMGSIDKVNLIKGLAAITGILGAIALFSKTVGNPIQLVIAGAAMLIIGNALQEIAKAVWVMGSIDKVNLVKGLAAVTGILIAIAAFSKTVGNPIQLVIAGAAMIIIGNALQEIAKAVWIMGAIDKVNLIKGLVAITAILAAIAAFNAVSGNPIKMAATAGALIILGIAMEGLSAAVGQMGSIPIKTIAKGLIGMGGALLIIAGAMQLMPLTMLLSATALVIVAGALKTLGEVMQDLGGMSWEEIARGLVALAGSLVIIAGAMYLMTAGIPGAAAMLVMAAALRVFVPVLTTLGNMSWAQIGIGLVALAGAFAVIGVAGLLLAPILPAMMGLAVTVALLGVGAMAAGLGLMLFSVGLTAIGVSGAVAIPILIELVKQIIALIPFALQQLGLGIIALAEVIAAAGGPLTEALVTLLLALLTAINTIAPPLVQTIIDLVWLLVNTLLSHLPNLIDAGFQLLVGFLDGIARNIGRVITSATDIIVNFLNGIANNIGRIIDAGVNLILKFIEGINRNVPLLLQAGADLIINFVQSLADTLRNNQSKMDAAGRDLAWAIADGMTGGLASKAKDMADKAWNFAKGALEAAKNALDSHSPSREFHKLGVWSGEGMVNGLVAMGSSVAKAGANMGDEALNGVKSSISKISDAVNTEMDVSPTIRPVLDLSAIKKDSNLINGLIGGGSLDIDTISANAIAAESGYLANLEAMQEAVMQTQSEPKSITYNQVNHSPKALSTIDIYRQTKNQLSSAKG